MKIFAIAFVSLFATAAFSCPPINSQFQCAVDSENPADTGKISVESIQQNGQTFYKWSDLDNGEYSVYPTDGQKYNMDDGGTYVGTCSGNNFQIVMTGTDTNIGPYTVDMYYTLDASQSLVNKGTVNFTYDGQNQTHAFESTCTKL